MKPVSNLALKAKILSASPLFASTSSTNIEILAKQSSLIAVPEGKDFSLDSPKGPLVAIIQSGILIELQRHDQNADDVMTGLYGPLDLAGFCNFQSDHAKKDRLSRRYRTVTNVNALTISTSDLLSIGQNDAEFLIELLSLQNSYNFETGDLLIKSAQTTLEDRLADFFTRISKAAEDNDWNPTVSLPRIAQTQLASMLGVTREYVNRTLNMWEQSGMIFIQKSGEIVIQNRKRLEEFVAESRKEEGQDERLSEIDRLLDSGLHHAAHHIALEAAKRFPRDEKVKHRAVLAMARSGDKKQALKLFAKFKLKNAKDNEDIACLEPRLYRDLARESANQEDYLENMQKSALGYEKAFDALSGYYAGINAAACYKLLGNEKKVTVLTDRVQSVLDSHFASFDHDEILYWSMATQAECELLKGNKDKAKSLFQAACRSSDVAAGKKSATRKNLSLLAEATKIDHAYINEAVPQPKVLFFSGPMAGHPDDNRQDQLNRLSDYLPSFLQEHQYGWAFGALASGSDIIIAEKALEAGLELHVVLPESPQVFLDNSVKMSGSDWVERYKACMRRATRIEWLRSPVQSNTVLFQHGANIAMGKAILYAEDLSTEAVGLFATQEESHASSTVSQTNCTLWREAGFEAIEVEDDWQKNSALTHETGAPSHQLAYAVIRLDVESPEKNIPPHCIATRYLPKQKVELLLFATLQAAIEGAQSLHKNAIKDQYGLAIDVGIIEDKEMQHPTNSTFRSFVIATTRPTLDPEAIFVSDAIASSSQITLKQPIKLEYAGFASTREKLIPCPIYRMV